MKGQVKQRNFTKHKMRKPKTEKNLIIEIHLVNHFRHLELDTLRLSYTFIPLL